jgi:murein DD-endopeptidase MepM/ murein hydrolase activator NlpD
MTRPWRFALALLVVALAPFLAPSAAPARVESATAGASRAHVVKSGDTLGRIARQYGVSVSSILSANALKNDRVRLKVGSRLAIPPPPAGASAPSKRPEQGKAPTRRVKGVATMRQPGRMPPNLILAIPEFADPVPLFAWPLEGGVSSNFGRRRMGWHRGIDIMAPPGAPIVAAAAGMVIASGVEGRYGRVVKLAHENGFTSVYAHNTENVVELGQWVSAGQIIATVGRTGRATGEHLHFEIRHEGLAYNPLYLLPLPPRVIQVDEVETDEDDEHD